MNKVAKLTSLLIALFTSHALAENSSVYTKLNMDKDCAPFGQYEVEGGSGAMICNGSNGLSIILSFGDLRESIEIYDEPFEDHETNWYSFSQWNSVNNVFEFRLADGVPQATIHRVFIDNINPDTGSADEKRRGQMLVITSIGRGNEHPSCMVGVVDALANKNANELARQLADNLALNITCGEHRPIYYGKIGPLVGQM